MVEHQYPINYAQRGVSLDTEGMNRSVNVAMPTVGPAPGLRSPVPGRSPFAGRTGGEDLLPGQTDAAAPDGPNDEVNTGYLWNNALRAGLTVRDYGFFVDTTCYNEPACQTPAGARPVRHQHHRGPACECCPRALHRSVLPRFRSPFPDYYRSRSGSGTSMPITPTGGLPNLTLVRFMHDHTGNFGTAIDGVNTPERDVADNDYAVGLLVQKIANSPIYKNNTLIFVVEDDAQDGGDHIDSHRTTAYVAGAYVRNALVSTPYNTIDFVRTMEEVLGLPADEPE